MSIRNELQEACGIKKLKKDTDDSLRIRISKKVEDLSDDDWDDLSEEAQVWCNAAVKALSKNQDVPPFPDEGEDSDPEDDEWGDEDEDTGQVEEVKPKKKAKAKAAEKSEIKTKEKKDKPKSKVAEKSETEVKEKKAKDAVSEKSVAKPKGKKAKDTVPKQSPGQVKHLNRGGGITAAIKRIVLDDPLISVTDLFAELAKRGNPVVSKMTVTTVRGDMRHTLAVMLDEGCLSKELEKKLR